MFAFILDLPTKKKINFLFLCVSVCFCVSASASFSQVSSPTLGVYRMPMGQLTLEVSSGDITKEACDVIVNSSNQNFNLQAGDCCPLQLRKVHSSHTALVDIVPSQQLLVLSERSTDQEGKKHEEEENPALLLSCCSQQNKAPNVCSL